MPAMRSWPRWCAVIASTNAVLCEFTLKCRGPGAKRVAVRQ